MHLIQKKQNLMLTSFINLLQSVQMLSTFLNLQKLQLTIANPLDEKHHILREHDLVVILHALQQKVNLVLVKLLVLTFVNVSQKIRHCHGLRPGHLEGLQ